MVAIYVTSPRGPEGKTTLCIGLARTWQQAGKKVGYIKPVAVTATEQPSRGDEDAAFAKKVLGLAEPAEGLCPLPLSAQGIAALAKQTAPEQKLVKACNDMAAGKDVVVLDGLAGQADASGTIARWLGARTIIVAGHRAKLAEDLPKAAKAFGQSLAGVVINAVPREKLETVSSGVVPSLEKAGVRVLVVLPEERGLATVTVQDLVAPLQARPITFKDGMGEIIESIMGGAVFLDPGPIYFERKANKAVVIRVDRPDVQLGALETSVRCLVLTNAEGDPNPYVHYKAMDKNVPILLTKMDTETAFDAIESTLNAARFRQEKKLAIADELLGKYLDIAALNKALGI